MFNQSEIVWRYLSGMDTSAALQVWEKLVLGIIVIAEPAAKALRVHKPHVVGVERIGNDQMRLRATRPDPVWQVVGIGVAEIKQSTGFHQKP